MDQKNFVVAIVLSVVIITSWQYFFPTAKPPQQQQTQTTAPNGPATRLVPTRSIARSIRAQRSCW